MDEIRAPSQAILRQPREIYNDQEQQSQIIPFRYRQPRRREWEQREYPDPLWGARLLAIFKLEMPKPDYSHPLPLFNTRPTQHSLSMNTIAHNTLGPTLQNVRVRRRNTLAYRMIQSPETGNQRAEAAGRDSGVTAKNRRWNLLDPRKASHERRKKDLLETLEPVLGLDDLDSSTIFLCWGKDNRCNIVPVKIPNSADDVTVWQEIRRVWYIHRGDWRKRLNLFGVRKVAIVEILIAGQESKVKQQTKHKGRFVGAYITEDLAAEKRRLEQIIANYDPQEFPCTYNPSTGQVDCFNSCISSIGDGIVCPERTLYQAQRELSRLKMRPFLTLAFSNPGVAALNGLLDGEGIINSQLNILSKLEGWHCPKLGELQFRALMIDEDWTPDSQHVVLPLTVTVIFLMVVGAKLVYGDWGTAWNVGCFFVALVALLWTWAKHTVG